MYALASTRVSILRGTSTDDYGDETDEPTVVASGVLACIREVASRVQDRTTGTPRQIRRVEAQLPSPTDVRVGDRLRDDRHHLTYLVENVTAPGGPGHTADLEVELKRVT